MWINSLEQTNKFFLKKYHLVLALLKFSDIIILHIEIAAVVQRLVHLIAIQMMTVRFRSVAPIVNSSLANARLLFWFFK